MVCCGWIVIWVHHLSLSLSYRHRESSKLIIRLHFMVFYNYAQSLKMVLNFPLSFLETRRRKWSLFFQPKNSLFLYSMSVFWCLLISGFKYFIAPGCNFHGFEVKKEFFTNRIIDFLFARKKGWELKWSPFFIWTKNHLGIFCLEKMLDSLLYSKNKTIIFSSSSFTHNFDLSPLLAKYSGISDSFIRWAPKCEIRSCHHFKKNHTTFSLNE